MRLIGVASIVLALAFTFTVAAVPPALTQAKRPIALTTKANGTTDTTTGTMTSGNIERVRPSSDMTLSETNSYGPMCCGCTK